MSLSYPHPVAATLAVSWWEVIILGFVQGATEWLPVSSSGHLVLAERMLGADAPTLLVLVLHIGTLLAVVVAYWSRLWAMLVSLRPGGDPGDRRLIGLLVVGTLPIVVAGLLLKDSILASFESLATTGAGLLITSAILFSTRYARPQVKESEIRWLQALLTGVGQALALLPGVSRSGATIAAGMHSGIERPSAADFAFLLAIPALVGATVLLSGDLTGLEGVTPGQSLVGLLVSFAVGYGTLRWLIGLVRRRGLAIFAPYCFVVGAITLFVGLR